MLRRDADSERGRYTEAKMVKVLIDFAF